MDAKTSPIRMDAQTSATQILLIAIALCGSVRADVTPTEMVIRRIDQMICDENVGPTAAICADEDFVRRVYLDFWGLIPSADAVTRFLGDASADKRPNLIHELVESPTFARHMAYVFNVHLLERRVDKGIDPAEWLEYLYQSFLRKKPCDQLFREILVADGRSGPDRVRGKFLLDRDCDPAGLVRDISRIYLGRDLQCAQCHDHPAISDYTQDEFFGLQAYLSRSFLFVDVPNNLTPYVGERAEGLSEYHSVFKKDEPNRLAIPSTPGHAICMPSVAAPGEDYVVAPADNVRPIPRKSFRSDLAAHATINNLLFDRALANRLWSQMFGHGIVDPIDMHHSDNPPSHPALLDFLAIVLRERKYDVGSYLAIIAQTEAYQRSIDTPTAAEIVSHRTRAAEIAAEQQVQVQKCTAELEELITLQQQTSPLKQEAETKVRGSLQSWIEIQKKFNQVDQELRNLEKTQAELAQQIESQRAKLKAVQDAVAKTDEAVKAVPDDPQLQSAAATLLSRSQELSAALTELEKKSVEQSASIQNQQASRTQLHTELSSVPKSMEAEYGPLQVAFARWRELEEKREQLRYRQAVARKRRAMAENLVKTAELHDQYGTFRVGASAEHASLDTIPVSTESIAPVVPPSELPKIAEELERLTKSLVQDWTDRFVLARPRQLAPEQLTWSVRQATGQLALDEQAAVEAWTSQHPVPDNLDPTSKAELEEDRQRTVRMAMIRELSGSVREFAHLFGSGAGQPQWDFHAAADQALFLSNSPAIHQQLNPQGQNLAQQLVQEADVKALAASAYLQLLSRRPTNEETQVVEEFMARFGDQKSVAVHELLWGLLTSAEFRFYR